MISEDKKILRKKYKDIRSSVLNTDVLSKEICSLVIGSDFYKNADQILAYWPTGSEADTGMIIHRALSDNKRVALPKCSDRNGNMRFYYIKSIEDLSEGMYGIMEPDESCEATDFSETSLCIVPALSFDKDGYRLGYGKGYYDRFLVNFSGVSAGICYDACLSENLPRNEFDKKVDYLITNLKLYDLR